MNAYHSNRENLVRIFEDTLHLCEANEVLKKSVEESINNSVLYKGNIYPELPIKKFSATKISVNKYRTFETVQFYKKKFPDVKVAALNFASATNVGGGVAKGSKAQEESLCRCSTLYPVLNTEYNLKNFYDFHRRKRDVRYTDSCIYSPNIVIFKSDTDSPQILPEKKWTEADILTCAAPNLRLNPNNFMNPNSGKPIKISDDELYKIHLRRAEHIFTIAAHHEVEILILGAFGCGAFQNNPHIVAEAYKNICTKFIGYFKEITFSIYCPPQSDSENFLAFNKMFTK